MMTSLPSRQAPAGDAPRPGPQAARRLRPLLLAVLGLMLAGAAASARELRAPELAARLGCFACHSLNGRGGKLALPLDGAGARLSPAQLEQVLTHPRQIHPGAKMPSYAYLPGAERQALVDFLKQLK
jgi:mono/diheme cytochrome c family protein